jgi:hypothetical protein
MLSNELPKHERCCTAVQKVVNRVAWLPKLLVGCPNLWGLRQARRVTLEAAGTPPG